MPLKFTVLRARISAKACTAVRIRSVPLYLLHWFIEGNNVGARRLANKIDPKITNRTHGEFDFINHRGEAFCSTVWQGHQTQNQINLQC